MFDKSARTAHSRENGGRDRNREARGTSGTYQNYYQPNERTEQASSKYPEGKKRGASNELSGRQQQQLAQNEEQRANNVIMGNFNLTV